MNTVLHSDPISAQNALSRLGLDERSLLEAAMQGYLAKTNCTANHPPLFASFVAWGETVRALREQLVTKGWTRNDDRNYSRIVHPDGDIAIAIATGDESTGNPNCSPCTKSAKGPSTVDAVEVNRAQAWLPGMEPASQLRGEQEENQPVTWLLLVHHAANEIRCELSLPFDMGSDSRIGAWSERILLPATPLDPQIMEITLPVQPDINVEIRRKA